MIVGQDTYDYEAAAVQRQANITEWKRRAAEARENGDDDVADGIEAFLAAGYD